MSKHTMMIVDDEPLSRYTIFGIASKHLSNIKVIAEAEDGLEAVEKALKHIPDIIIMDMKIPEMNGIEAGRKILKNHPETSIIALTAFNEFDYAKDALNAGFAGFLLKPVDTDQFIETVEKCLAVKISDSTEIRDFNQKTEDFFIKEFLSTVSGGCSNKNKIEEYFRLLKINFSHGYFITAGYGLSDIEINEDFTKLFECEYQRVMSGNFIISSYRKEYITILDFNNSEAFSRKEQLYKLHRRLQTKYNISIAFGISNNQTNTLLLSLSLNESEIAYHEAAKDLSVIHIKELNKDANRSYPKAIESLVTDHLKIRDYNWIQKNKKSIVNSVIPESSDLLTAKDNCTKLLIKLKSSNLLNNLVSQEYSFLHQIYAANNQSELRLLISRYIELLTINRDESLEKENQFLIQMNKYIDNNIVSDITLESAATAAGLSPSYFSKIFKEYTGFNFIDYITRKRILTAKKQLTRTNKKVKEISAEVGFIDSAYFSKLFKKATGFTPADFRKNHRREFQ